MGYRYEKISPGHIDDLIYIYRDAFGKEVDRQYIYSRQDISAFGPSFVGYITAASRECTLFLDFPMKKSYPRFGPALPALPLQPGSLSQSKVSAAWCPF